MLTWKDKIHVTETFMFYNHEIGWDRAAKQSFAGCKFGQLTTQYNALKIASEFARVLYHLLSLNLLYTALSIKDETIQLSGDPHPLCYAGFNGQ